MANARLGNHSSHNYQVAENIKENTQLVWNDSGKLFYCYTGASDISIHLPKISEEIAGWQAKFILTDASNDNDILIKGYGITATVTTGDNVDNDVIYYVEHSATPEKVELADYITIAGGSADNLGTSVQVHTDGTYWYIMVITPTAAIGSATG